MHAIEPIVAHRQVTIGSNRGFALVFAAAFAVIALMPLRHDGPIRWWAVGVTMVVLAVGLTAPHFLSPLNRLWFRLGLATSQVVSPIIMGVVYYAAVVPTGLIVRARRKDPLRLKWDPGTPTYWVRREPPDSGSMSRQF